MTVPNTKPAPWMPTYSKQDAAVATVMFLLLLAALYTATLVVGARAGQQATNGSRQQTQSFAGLFFSTPDTWLQQTLRTPDGKQLDGVALFVDPSLNGFETRWVALNLGPDADPLEALPVVAQAMGMGDQNWVPASPSHQPIVRDERLVGAITGETWLTLENGQTIQAFLGLVCTKDGRGWAFRMTHAIPQKNKGDHRQIANQLIANSLITSARLPRFDPNAQPKVLPAPENATQDALEAAPPNALSNQGDTSNVSPDAE